MTNTANFDKVLLQLGFEPESRDGWFFHWTEPVRFVWEDAESGAFKLFRFEYRRPAPVAGPGSAGGGLESDLGGRNLDEETFRAVIRAFVNG